jgi:hypothetical protein
MKQQFAVESIENEWSLYIQGEKSGFELKVHAGGRLSR